MLTIKFSHHYPKMPPGGFKPGDKTSLADYLIVDDQQDHKHLPHVNAFLDKQFQKPWEFLDYDTRYYPAGVAQIAKYAHFFKLPKRGPFLILFFKTNIGSELLGPHYWTTIRCPWRRMQKGPGWAPSLPKKYRPHLGKEVRIVIEGEVKA